MSTGESSADGGAKPHTPSESAKALMIRSVKSAFALLLQKVTKAEGLDGIGYDLERMGFDAADDQRHAREGICQPQQPQI